MDRLDEVVEYIDDWVHELETEFKEFKKRKVDNDVSIEVIMYHILGHTFEEAEKIVKEKWPSYHLKLFFQNGKMCPSIRDYRIRRLNVIIQDGIIIKNVTHLGKVYESYFG